MWPTLVAPTRGNYYHMTSLCRVTLFYWDSFERISDNCFLAVCIKTLSLMKQQTNSQQINFEWARANGEIPTLQVDQSYKFITHLQDSQFKSFICHLHNISTVASELCYDSLTQLFVFLFFLMFYVVDEWATCSEHIFRILGDPPSGPAAFWGFTYCGALGA